MSKVDAAARLHRFLQKAPEPEPMQSLARYAAELAGDELDVKFGADFVAVVYDCNQFLRLYKAGDHAGQAELWLPDGYEGQWGPALGGAVFQMFGWRSAPAGPDLEPAVRAAFERASGAPAPHQQ